MEPFGSLLLTGCRCCTKCQITHARKKLIHEMDNLCGAHVVLLMHGICARLCTKDYMQQRQDLYKRVVAGTGSDNRALWVKLTKMLYIPGVSHRNAIFGLKADSAGPSDSFHPIRAFPLRRQLVGILGRLNAPKNKVAFLEASGLNFAAMVAAQSLLVSRGSYRSLKTVFLKEQRVILAQLLLLELIISEYSR